MKNKLCVVESIQMNILVFYIFIYKKMRQVGRCTQNTLSYIKITVYTDCLLAFAKQNYYYVNINKKL